MATLPQTIHLATPLPGPEARALDERAGTALPRALTAAMPTFARRTDRGVLEDVDGIEFCHLTSADVVRHELVGHIIDAYQRWEDGAARRRSARSRARHPREDRS